MLLSWVRRLPALAPLVLAGSAALAADAVVKVGIEPNAEPLSYVDTSGRPAGFAIDLLRAVARSEQLDLQLVVEPWSQVLDDVRAGRLDMVANVAYLPEREEFIDFAVAHIDMRAAIFVNRHSPPLSSLADLSRLRVGVAYRSLSHEYAIKRGWTRQLQNYDTLHDGLKAVNEGSCDALIATQLIGAKIVRDLQLQNVTTADLEIPDLTYQLHMGVHKGNAHLLFQLNRGLALSRTNGTYDQLYERWIGPLQPRRVRLKDMRSFLIGLAVLAIGIAGAFAWQRHLLTRLARQAAELRRNEERLSLVLEGSEDGFWDWDMTTGHFERSERWAAMLGYTLAEIPTSQEGGKLLIHPDDLGAYAQWRPRLDSGETNLYSIEYRMKAKSGEWRWVHDRGKVVARAPDGRPLRMAGTHTDITERKRTEAALLESQELLKRSAHLLEQTQAIAKIGGWEVDLRTDQLYWSSETYRLHDTSPGEYRPAVETAITFYTAESRALITAAVENAVRHGTPYDLELDVITAKGRRIRIHTTGRAETENGHVVKIYGSFRDITVERGAEEERKKLQLKMLEAQKLESLGVLAGGIAHDFNNLLTVILANATFVREDSGGNDPRIAHIETAARRAADLCRQMLAYAGRGTFLVERSDLGQLVKDTAQLLQVSISKKARLTVTLAPGLPPVQADASQLRQVVMNLVINASEALGDVPGDIRLTTRLARPETPPGGSIHSFDLPPGDCVCVEIADTGHGMSPATLARVFDPFFTTKFAGRGLGLAAVLGIVRAHHGALTVESALGRGTTFRLFLSAGQDAVSPTSPATTRAPVRGAGGTILLVDDEPVVLATADALLRHNGYKTVLAADGHEAVHQFRANPRGFAAVALDLTMPGLDGGEVLRVMRAINPEVRVLIMSGFSEQDILARVRGQGPVPVLRKPFTHETLLAKLAETING